MFDLAQERPTLVRLAYRITGRVSVAEELTQEALIRLAAATDIQHPRAWLTTVLTRLSLDYVKSAAVKREQYIGPWMPDPWVCEMEDEASQREQVSMAMMMLLHELPPTHRAAFVLRELFDEDYGDIAAALGCLPATARQWTVRARRALAGKLPPTMPMDAQLELLVAFGMACESGDLTALKALLATDIEALADSNGEVAGAGRRVVVGADRVARLYIGLRSKWGPALQVQPCWVNDSIALKLLSAEGELQGYLISTMSEGRLVGLQSFLAPSRLRALVR